MSAGQSGDSVVTSRVPHWAMDMRHLTWRGRVSMAYYALRRLVVAPAPTPERCCMGSTIGPHVWCPRQAAGLWCRHHEKDRTIDNAQEATA